MNPNPRDFESDDDYREACDPEGTAFDRWRESESYQRWLSDTAEDLLAGKGLYDGLYDLRQAGRLPAGLDLLSLVGEFSEDADLTPLLTAIVLDEFAPNPNENRTDFAVTDFVAELKRFVINRLQGHARLAFDNMQEAEA